MTKQVTIELLKRAVSTIVDDEEVMHDAIDNYSRAGVEVEDIVRTALLDNIPLYQAAAEAAVYLTILVDARIDFESSRSTLGTEAEHQQVTQAMRQAGAAALPSICKVIDILVNS